MLKIRGSDDYVRDAGTGVPEGDDAELAVAPLDPEVVAARRRIVLERLAELPAPPEEEPPSTFRFQFTIREILIFTAGVATALAFVRALSAPIVAGVAAALALVCLPFLHVLPLPVRKAWWVLVGLYLVSCLVATDLLGLMAFFR